jgi:hypothetical protein
MAGEDFAPAQPTSAGVLLAGVCFFFSGARKEKSASFIMPYLQ